MAEKKKQESKGQAIPVEHMEVDFPRKFPSDSIMHMVNLARGTETLTKGQVLQHLGIIAGCSGKLLDGAPEPVGASAAKQSSARIQKLSGEELASELEAAIAPQASSADPAEAFPWALLMPLIMDVVRRYFGW